MVLVRRTTLKANSYDRLNPDRCSYGEGELPKKRTDRGYVSGSGIKTRQPICDGWLRQSWAFFSQLMVGGKGAFAQNSPTIIGLVTMNNTFVYFIAERYRKALGGKCSVKIGVARKPETRLGELQVGNPRKLEIAMTIGPMTEKQAYNLEAFFHRKFKCYRYGGEWFNRIVFKKINKLSSVPIYGEIRAYEVAAGAKGLRRQAKISEELDERRRFEMESVAGARLRGL